MCVSARLHVYVYMWVYLLVCRDRYCMYGCECGCVHLCMRSDEGERILITSVHMFLTVLGSSVGRATSSEAADRGFKPRPRHTKVHYKNGTSSFPVCAQY